MQMTEAITIYLAAGAPFGVSRYLRRERGAGRTRALLFVLWATLAWPMTASRLLWMRTRGKLDRSARHGDAEARTEHGEKVELARRQLLATLHRVQELAMPGTDSERSERFACVFRDSLEKYIGLTLSADEMDGDAPPSEREMELCRIAGRTGQDLLLAGRCIHRKNVARLLAHREQARTALLHALAEIRELSGADAGDSSARESVLAARHLSVAVLRFYGQAINLLSLLEDEEAARKVARLLDAECARLRRLEAQSPERSHDEEHPAGEESCRPHSRPHERRLAFTGPSQTSPLTRG
jgi:hypothetical protein